MADAASSKRQREEILGVKESEALKRHKSYDFVLSLSEDGVTETSEEFSSLIALVQDRASPFEPIDSVEDSGGLLVPVAVDMHLSSSLPSFRSEEREKENESERVLRLLLEASDDELGIPSRDQEVVEEYGGDLIVYDYFDEFGWTDGFTFYDGLWQFEDLGDLIKTHRNVQLT